MVEELHLEMPATAPNRRRGRPLKEVRRIYANNAEKQAAYRERKFEREHSAAAEVWMDEWAQRFPAEAAEIDQYVRDVQRQVAEELGVTAMHPGKETVDRVARLAYGFTKAAATGKNAYIWLREVHQPDGVIVAGHCFPEVIGEGVVRDTCRYGLKKSATYKPLYDSLLQTLDEKFGESSDPLEQHNADVVRQELDGKYIPT